MNRKKLIATAAAVGMALVSGRLVAQEPDLKSGFIAFFGCVMQAKAKTLTPEQDAKCEKLHDFLQASAPAGYWEEFKTDQFDRVEDLHDFDATLARALESFKSLDKKNEEVSREEVAS